MVTIKKAKKTTKFNRIHVFFLLIGGGLLLITLVAQFLLITHLLSRTTHLEEATIKHLIAESLKSINKEAAVEPSTGKVYMYEPRLSLPPYPNELFTGIRYSHTPASADTEEELQITSNAALNRGISTLHTPAHGEGFFDKVPFAQSCSRQAIITFKPGVEPSFKDYSHAGSRSLADGRTLELFTADDCSEGSEILTAYLKQLQSY